MDIYGRYTHIEDVLVNLHTGQWFGWSDSKNKIYENLILHDSSITKPTEKELTDALAKQQSDFDAQEYARIRSNGKEAVYTIKTTTDEKGHETNTSTLTEEAKIGYPNIGEQLDMLWHAIDGDALDKTSDFYIKLKKVKDDNPKPS